MPDRLDENGFVATPAQPSTPAHWSPAAITACSLCDDHGYRGAAVCDHEDHQEAAKRGMDAIRAAMGWDQ